MWTRLPSATASVIVDSGCRTKPRHDHRGPAPAFSNFRARRPVPGQRVFEQVIVSNVDLVLPVFAVADPTPKWGLLDRYLVSAEAAEMPALIVINKLDLAWKNQGFDAEIEIYRRIGYPVLLVSADHRRRHRRT